MITSNGTFGFDASVYGFETIDIDDGWSTASNSASRSPSQEQFRPCPYSGSTKMLPLPTAVMSFQATPHALTESPLSLHNLISYWAGVVVYLVSSTNWGVVFTRIRKKIRELAQPPIPDDTQSILSSDDMGLDVGDLGLLQHCAMDRTRLIQILQGV